ncbi:MAG: NAD(P)/FAD-dependent oxidoreductase [Candidatus Muiribacteriota bacterium]
MNNFFDLIIIGGGPAGLFSGIIASKKYHDKKILILEKKESCGLKLLLTGNGQCNLTNNSDIFSFYSKYGENGKFLKYAFKAFSNKDLIFFFNKENIKFKIIKDKIFPVSEKAGDILKKILNIIQSNSNIILKTNQAVKEISKNNDFEIKTENNSFYSNKLILATGGKSYPKTGSTGDGYFFAKGFNHKIATPSPALCGIEIKNHFLTELSGISLENSFISLIKNGKKFGFSDEPFLITHKGLSGPAILHLSRYIESGDALILNFLKIDFNILQKNIIEFQRLNGEKTILYFFKQYSLPVRLIKILLKNEKIDLNLKIGQLNKDLRKKICHIFTNFKVNVSKKGDFNSAMVTAGGVYLKEINPKTMESRLLPGLFFAGEIMDLDGNTGGYNLQMCFSTAYLSAINLFKKYKD